MSFRLASILFVLAIASCGQSTAPAGEMDIGRMGMESVVTTQDGLVRIGPATFRVVDPVDLGIRSAPSIWAALEPAFGHTPESMEGRQGMDIWMHEDESRDQFVVGILRFGLLDDAVKADETRVTFAWDGTAWRPTAAYLRQQCRRMGDGEWTTEPCP